MSVGAFVHNTEVTTCPTFSFWIHVFDGIENIDNVIKDWDIISEAIAGFECCSDVTIVNSEWAVAFITVHSFVREE